MAAFLKHIGKHGDRKVLILFRKVPNESHMTLVIYPQVLNAAWHDAIMKVLESDVGQQANEFSEALHRSLLPDGRPILETLHQEGMIKKIRTEDVVVTPQAGSTVKLSELNSILDQMEAGEAAVEKMKQLDESRGMVAPDVKRKAEAEFKAGRELGAPPPRTSAPLTASSDGALDDHAIASDMLAQAEQMETEAKSMVAEAKRMKKEAEALSPSVTASKQSTTATKKTRTTKNKKAVADATQ